MSNRENATRHLNVWYYTFVLWSFLHWVLLLIISAGSAAVASAVIATSLKDPLALIVAIAGAIFAAIKPSEKADAYREAWVGLNTATMKGTGIIEAYTEGERIIGQRARAREALT